MPAPSLHITESKSRQQSILKQQQNGGGAEEERRVRAINGSVPMGTQQSHASLLNDLLWVSKMQQSAFYRRKQKCIAK